MPGLRGESSFSLCGRFNRTKSDTSFNVSMFNQQIKSTDQNNNKQNNNNLVSNSCDGLCGFLDPEDSVDLRFFKYLRIV